MTEHLVIDITKARSKEKCQLKASVPSSHYSSEAPTNNFIFHRTTRRSLANSAVTSPNEQGPHRWLPIFLVSAIFFQLWLVFSLALGSKEDMACLCLMVVGT